MGYDGEWMPLAGFLEKFREGKAEASSAPRAPSTVSRSTDALKEQPWVLGVFWVVEQREKKSQLARKQRVSSSKARKVVKDNDGQSSSSEEEEFDAEENADIGQALDELHRATEDAALRPGGDSTDFITVILGGGWTMTHKGKAYDVFRLGARVRANRFCERCGLQKSMRFSVTLFGDNVACSLAKAWCSRLQFFFDEFQDSGNDGHIFDECAAKGSVKLADFLRFTDGRGCQRTGSLRANRCDHASGPVSNVRVSQRARADA